MRQFVTLSRNPATRYSPGWPRAKPFHPTQPAPGVEILSNTGHLPKSVETRQRVAERHEIFARLPREVRDALNKANTDIHVGPTLEMLLDLTSPEEVISRIHEVDKETTGKCALAFYGPTHPQAQAYLAILAKRERERTKNSPKPRAPRGAPKATAEDLANLL